MSAWQVYLVLKLDDIGMLLGVSVLVCLLIAGGAVVGSFISWDTSFGHDDKADVFRKGKAVAARFAVAAAAFAVVATFVPSTKQMAMVYVVPQIVNSEKVQAEASELYDLAKAWMRETLKDKNK